MEIGYVLGNILIEVGVLCLVASGFITMYEIGIKHGRKRAIDDVKELLRKNSDEKGICQINIEG